MLAILKVILEKKELFRLYFKLNATNKTEIPKEPHIQPIS